MAHIISNKFPKDADIVAYSVDPDQTAPVCPKI